MAYLKKIAFPLLLIVVFLISGCSDLFDEGDTNRAYSGPDQVGFADLESTVNEGTTLPIEIQLISAQGLAQSDINVSVSVSEESTLDSNDYTLSSTTLTINSGSVSTAFDVEISDDAVNGNEEERLILILSSEDVQVAPNFSNKTIFVRSN